MLSLQDKGWAGGKKCAATSEPRLNPHQPLSICNGGGKTQRRRHEKSPADRPAVDPALPQLGADAGPSAHDRGDGRGAGPAAGDACLWVGRDRARAIDGQRVRADRKHIGRCRRFPAVPPLRQPVGQSFVAGRHAARAGRQCVEPDADAAGRRAAGRSLFRLYPLRRAGARATVGGAGNARRRQRRLRVRRGGGHDRARKRNPGAVARCRGERALWQPRRDRSVRDRDAGPGRWLCVAVGTLGPRRRLLHDAARPTSRSERAGRL